jgi:ribose 5-phosphate isomerase B
MRVAVGCDHNGLNFKQEVIAFLLERGHTYEDMGCYDSNSVDYPDIAQPVAEGVASGRFDQGVLICSNGIGMSITANKVPGVRAALCNDVFSAQRCREHNDANVLCLGEWSIGKGVLRSILEAYFTSDFLGGRHAQRVEKIRAVESAHRPAGVPTS